MDEDIFDEKDTVIYNIKSLDKLILRNFGSNMGRLKDEYGFRSAPSRSQIEIMQYMLEHLEEDVYQRDLEDILGLRRATISGILGTMEKNGFIEREVDEKDTRTKKIRLSPKAKEGYVKVTKYLKILNDEITNGINQDDLNLFYKVLNKMKNNLEEVK